ESREDGARRGRPALRERRPPADDAGVGSRRVLGGIQRAPRLGAVAPDVDDAREGEGVADPIEGGRAAVRGVREAGAQDAPLAGEVEVLSGGRNVQLVRTGRAGVRRELRKRRGIDRARLSVQPTRNNEGEQHPERVASPSTDTLPEHEASYWERT